MEPGYAWGLVAIIVLIAVLLIPSMMISVLTKENKQLRQQIAKFDRDGDGRIGGSKRRAF